jgi:hypothetical protein
MFYTRLPNRVMKKTAHIFEHQLKGRNINIHKRNGNLGFNQKSEKICGFVT